MNVFIRKIIVAFVVGFASVFLIGAPGLIDAFESQNWSMLHTAGIALIVGAIGGGFRALVSLTTGFIPSDSTGPGVNIIGTPPDES